MSETLKFGGGIWATKEGSTLAYNDENGNFKPLPFTFDRSTSATRVNKEGLIEVVSNNEPRIDFLNDSKGALKLEPLRSNLITYSEDFSQGYWIKQASSITSNSIISPDGNLNADLYTTSSATFDFIQTTGSFIVSGYSFSIFAKKGTSDKIDLALSGAAFTDTRSVRFDLTNKTTETLGGILSSKIEEYPNGWFRCSIYAVTNAVGSGTIRILSGSTDNVSTLYIWGAQLEQGYLTSYIPTQGSIGTRVAETCSDAGNEQVFNDSEGVLFAEISALDEDAGTERYIYIGNGTTANRVVIRYSTTQNDIRMLVTSGGSTQVSSGTTNYNITENHKIALKYKANDFALWIDGVEVLTDTNGSTPTGINQLTLSYSGTQFYGNTKQIKYFNQALTDQELQALTSN